MDLLEALDKMIEVFLSTSNDVDKSYNELENFEINLLKIEPDIFQLGYLLLTTRTKIVDHKRCKEKVRGLQSIDFIGNSAFRPVL